MRAESVMMPCLMLLLLLFRTGDGVVKVSVGWWQLLRVREVGRVVVNLTTASIWEDARSN